MLTVGAILREPLAATLRFVSWYLEAGADRIVLCFDDPWDPAIDLLKDHPQVQVIRCTRRFWLDRGCRPRTRFTKRQNLAMQHVYDGLTEGWFLNVDGDELVHLQARSLRHVLAAQPEAVRAVTIRPAEHLNTPQSAHQHFRMAMSAQACNRLYGAYAPYMIMRRGLSGHTIGKTATRAGLKGHVMRQHFMQTPEGAPVLDRVLGHGEGAYVLHFFDQGYDSWRAKLDWRLSARGFRQGLKEHLTACLERPDPEPDLRAVYEALHVFDGARLGQLDLLQAGLEVRLDMQALVRDHFGQKGIAAVA